MSEERRIIHEITPLMGKDVLYIADRHKKEFTYPIHNHSVFELNFVENAQGVRRIVGDSQEVIGEYDLCLITSAELEHVWEQNECKSEDIREITIQFDFSMGDETLFGRNPYSSITRMMQEARKGLVFPMKAIMKVYSLLDTLSSIKDGFYAVQQFLSILYDTHVGFQQLCQGDGRGRQPSHPEGKELYIQELYGRPALADARRFGWYESKRFQPVLQAAYRA